MNFEKIHIERLNSIDSSSPSKINLTSQISNNDSDNNINHLYNDDNNYVNIIKKNKLLVLLIEIKKKIKISLHIISAKYDIIYFKYNLISLLILIISTIVTFIEAFRLTITSYIDTNKINVSYSSYDLTFYINIISLLLGTILTILSSIIKFKNYRDTMEKIKNIQNTLFNHKILLNKQKELIKYFEINNDYCDETFKKLFKKVIDYNNQIKDINIFENIRINDIVKYNKFKITYDIEIQKLILNKKVKLLKINNTFKYIKNKYNE